MIGVGAQAALGAAPVRGGIKEWARRLVSAVPEKTFRLWYTARKSICTNRVRTLLAIIICGLMCSQRALTGHQSTSVESAWA